MVRVAMRGIMIVLALVLIVASAGTVLCEMDCAASGHPESVAAMTPMNVGASHCDGEQMDLAQPDTGAHHGSSGGNTKHRAHLHTGIVATVGARVLISPAIKFSASAVASVDFGAPVFARFDENFWRNNSTPPINSSFVFAVGVLRI
ncbi:MAG TPA: hypothetical protein VIH72_04360 [Candidatus Acidoferrales bacterium]|jgi:hypothetical protein